MELEKHVCSLELAKRLKELGVRQESVFFWSKLSISTSEPQLEMHQHLQTQEIILADCTQYWAAFTVAELGYILPDSCYTQKDNSDIPESWICHLEDINAGRNYFVEKTEADARAKMLIYLIENKLINCS